MNSTTEYSDFLQSKSHRLRDAGFSIDRSKINPLLYDFQRDIVAWAIRKGRSAVFCDCGLGKTPIQLDWASHIPGRVLILAPLAVAEQTVREGIKFGIPCEYHRSEPGKGQIVVTNYEMLDRFDVNSYTGVVLDESSILKSYSGVTKKAIIEAFACTPYKLACTATPAPNDYLELGNHSEFLGVMDRWTMRSTFFVHDSQLYGPGQHSGDVRNYRLKKHSEDAFWDWVSSWAVVMRTPDDLGYDGKAFHLPPLKYHEIEALTSDPTPGFLFPMAASTLQERIAARRDTSASRVEACADIINSSDEQWIVWCGLNKESTLATKLIDGAVEVTGSDSNDAKTSRMLGFADGTNRVLVTKPKIAGFGMNFQNCHNVAFVGLSDSWESYYQAVRRCWRFGQDKQVNVHVVTSDIEGKVVANIKRKEAAADAMHSRVAKRMAVRSTLQTEKEVRMAIPEHNWHTASGTDWDLHLGDSVEVLRSFDEGTCDFSIFSPPFISLFIYSDSPRDVGNCQGDDEFFKHIGMVYEELFRVMAPGRLVAVHTTDIPRTLNWDGYMGLRDFRGETIRELETIGFNYHSAVTIWKNPVVEMQRTKALGLRYKQLKKDSTRSRMGTAGGRACHDVRGYEVSRAPWYRPPTDAPGAAPEPRRRWRSPPPTPPS